MKNLRVYTFSVIGWSQRALESGPFLPPHGVVSFSRGVEGGEQTAGSGGRSWFVRE